MNKGKVLFVFDFDDTLVEGWSDSWAFKVAPELNITDEEVSSLLEQLDNSWCAVMNILLGKINESGHDKHELIKHMKTMPLKKGMTGFLNSSRDRDDVDVVILSDANEVFVRAVLESAGCLDTIKELYANPAYFDEEGQSGSLGALKVKKYHPHKTCSDCTDNSMCKGAVLSNTILSSSVSPGTSNSSVATPHEGRLGYYRKIVYVGDGMNDLCPCKRLTSNDCIVARDGYQLAKLLTHDDNSCQNTICEQPLSAAEVKVANFDGPKLEEILTDLIP